MTGLSARIKQTDGYMPVSLDRDIAPLGLKIADNGCSPASCSRTARIDGNRGWSIRGYTRYLDRIIKIEKNNISRSGLQNQRST